MTYRHHNHAPVDYDIQERFVPAIGPGGRHLCKASTAVELRVNLRSLPVPLEVKHRLRALAGRRVTNQDVLIVASRAHRSQQKNREAAQARLVALLDRAATPPGDRRPTGPATGDRERRLTLKKRRGAMKRSRHPGRLIDE